MRKRTLGKSDLHVSEIAFGCMSLDLSQLEKDNHRLIDQAIDHGINYFDTADLYDFGENERFLAKALTHQRSKVILATKAGNEWKPDKSWEWNPSKSYIIQAAENSLKRLKTDYIDLFQLHGGTTEDPFDEVIESFELLQKEGKIRYFGISSIRPNVIRRFAEDGRISTNMMQYGLLDRRPEEEALEVLGKRGISVVARGVLAKGILAGKEPREFLDLPQKEVKKYCQKIAEFGSLQSIAMQYALASSTVSSLVLGIRTLHQLEEAIAAYHQPPLAQESLKEIRTILPEQRYDKHR